MPLMCQSCKPGVGTGDLGTLLQPSAPSHPEGWKESDAPVNRDEGPTVWETLHLSPTHQLVVFTFAGLVLHPLCGINHPLQAAGKKQHIKALCWVG